MEAKVFACCLYLHGSSFRQTADLLGELGIRTTKSAVWYWFQQVGAEIGERFARRKPRRYPVVDETRVRTRSGDIWIFAGIDPENWEIVGVHVSRSKGVCGCAPLPEEVPPALQGQARSRDRRGTVVQRWPAQRLGLMHAVLVGGIRSYIERLFETVKGPHEGLRLFLPHKPDR